ncbi:MAG TPA: PadR family transcriptional regulator [Pilimelia sp.]|nr:PadR family transcriptional regulator [Pilimelia sp.]
MSVRLALLGLLSGASSHGYRLKSRYDDVLDPDGSVPAAQIYATLSRLERDGLVRQAETTQDGGPPRRVYQLTEAGRCEIDRWLAAPVEPAPELQALLYTKVVLSIIAGRRIEPLLDAQREAHLVRMRELTGMRQSQGLARKILAEYALFHLEADLKWLDLVAEQVTELVAGVETDRRAADR